MKDKVEKWLKEGQNTKTCGQSESRRRSDIQIVGDLARENSKIQKKSTRASQTSGNRTYRFKKTDVGKLTMEIRDLAIKTGSCV